MTVWGWAGGASTAPSAFRSRKGECSINCRGYCATSWCVFAHRRRTSVPAQRRPGVAANSTASGLRAARRSWHRSSCCRSIACKAAGSLNGSTRSLGPTRSRSCLRWIAPYGDAALLRMVAAAWAVRRRRDVSKLDSPAARGRGATAAELRRTQTGRVGARPVANLPVSGHWRIARDEHPRARQGSSGESLTGPCRQGVSWPGAGAVGKTNSTVSSAQIPAARMQPAPGAKSWEPSGSSVWQQVRV